MDESAALAIAAYRVNRIVRRRVHERNMEPTELKDIELQDVLLTWVYDRNRKQRGAWFGIGDAAIELGVDYSQLCQVAEQLRQHGAAKCSGTTSTAGMIRVEPRGIELIERQDGLTGHATDLFRDVATRLMHLHTAVDRVESQITLLQGDMTSVVRILVRGTPVEHEIMSYVRGIATEVALIGQLRDVAEIRAGVDQVLARLESEDFRSLFQRIERKPVVESVVASLLFEVGKILLSRAALLGT